MPHRLDAVLDAALRVVAFASEIGLVVACRQRKSTTSAERQRRFDCFTHGTSHPLVMDDFAGEFPSARNKRRIL
jgi:hypothetical protein